MWSDLIVFPTPANSAPFPVGSGGSTPAPSAQRSNACGCRSRDRRSHRYEKPAPAVSPTTADGVPAWHLRRCDWSNLLPHPPPPPALSRVKNARAGTATPPSPRRRARLAFTWAVEQWLEGRAVDLRPSGRTDYWTSAAGTYEKRMMKGTMSTSIPRSSLGCWTAEKWLVGRPQCQVHRPVNRDE